MTRQEEREQIHQELMIARLAIGDRNGVPAASLDEAELERVFQDVSAPAYCIRKCQQGRDAGWLTMDKVQAVRASIRK